MEPAGDGRRRSRGVLADASGFVPRAAHDQGAGCPVEAFETFGGVECDTDLFATLTLS